MTLKERAEISKRQNYEAFKDIYEYCEKNGCDKDFVDAFRARMFISPIQQTKCFIESVRRNSKYGFDQIGKLRKWKTYLSVLLELRPKHDKVDEWKESLSIIDYYEKTSKCKDSEPWGFWLIYIGENDYTDILIEQNGADSKIIQALDEDYDRIISGRKEDEDTLSAIRNYLIKNGYIEEVKKCDAAFIKKYQELCKVSSKP